MLKEVLATYGISGLMGLAGVYGVFCSIAGTLVKIPGFTPPQRSLKHGQRVLLATMGILCAFPLFVTLYREALFGTKTVIAAPSIEEFVAPVKQGKLIGISLPPTTLGECTPVESFGLQEYQERTLKYARFQGRAVVRLNSVEEAYLTIGETKYWLKINKRGDYIDFKYSNYAYRLTATAIYLGVGNVANTVALEVCEW